MHDNTELFELMTKIYGELQETKKIMNDKFEQIDSRFEQIDSRFEQIDSRFEQTDSRFGKLENKVDKNTILLERLDSKIKLIAEVQQSFQEQLGRNLLADGKTIGERLDIIELAVTNGSESIIELQDNLDVVKETVGIHEMDLRMIKHKKSHAF